MDRRPTEFMMGMLQGYDMAVDECWEKVVHNLVNMRISGIITQKQEDLIRVLLHKIFY